MLKGLPKPRLSSVRVLAKTFQGKCNFLIEVN
jgi:hypothetical protein